MCFLTTLQQLTNAALFTQHQSEDENIKYIFSSSGNRIHKLSCRVTVKVTRLHPYTTTGLYINNTDPFIRLEF